MAGRGRRCYRPRARRHNRAKRLARIAPPDVTKVIEGLNEILGA